tara:strand:+ start:767 stop:1294 length:528 start_codon:yes stop_codon:yes gene_type:complete
MAVIEAITTTYLQADTGYIQWLSIPQTYEHLQIRASFQDGNATNNATNFALAVYVNNDNNTSSYTKNYLRGSNTTSLGAANAASSEMGFFGADPDIPNYGTFVIDILDYTNPNKLTTITALNGYNGTVPMVTFGGSVFHNGADTDAVDQILLVSYATSNFLAGGSATLYGMKAAN